MTIAEDIEKAKARVDASADKLRLLLGRGGCRAFVEVENLGVIVNVPMEYFGQAQAIIRSNRIACVVRPY